LELDPAVILINQKLENNFLQERLGNIFRQVELNELEEGVKLCSAGLI